MGADRRKREDSYVRRLRDELRKAYGAKHPRAQVDVKRSNSACVRIRILDPGFARKGWTTRNDAAWKILETLPHEWRDQVSMLILMTPKEAAASLMNRFEFEEFTPSSADSCEPS